MRTTSGPVPQGARGPGAVVAVLAVLGVLALAGCGRTLLPVAAAAADCGPGWVAGWHAAQQAVPGDRLAGRTLRMAVRVGAEGTRLRLRLSHRHGDGVLRIGAATVGRAGTGAAVVAPAPVRFGGRPDAVLPPGAQVSTDPVPAAVRRGETVVVSLHLAEVPATISSHPVAMRTAWLSGPGDRTAAPGADGFATTLQSWPVLAGVDVLADRPDAGLLVIGDSLVDGVGSTPGGDDRFPDRLAARLDAGGGPRTTVLNAGLSRNRLLADDPPAGGDSPLRRFDVDVAAVGGVRDVLLLAGTNDVGAGAGGDEIADAVERFARRARAAGLRVLVATIPPSTSGGRDAPAAVEERERANDRIRSDGPRYADGVIDAAGVLADPADPTRLRPDLDSGDGLHPSPAGYRALAAVVPLGALSGSPCRAAR